MEAWELRADVIVLAGNGVGVRGNRGGEGVFKEQ